MKRKASTRVILTLLLALALALSSLLLTSCSSEPTDTVTLLYEERDSGILITGYDGVLREDAELKIPDTINSKEVVAIADEAFAGKGDLRRAVIPASVCTIGEGAFKNCKNLEYVNIPAGVTEIKDDVFYGCKMLKEVNLPDGLTSIGEDAFKNCSAVEHLTAHGWALPYFNLAPLKSLNIRGTLEISRGMLESCNKLESITVPFVGSDENATADTHLGFIFGAKSAEENASAIPPSLKKVVITGGKIIDDNAFAGASSITTVILPKGLETIGAGAFEGCAALTKAAIPATVKYIGDSAFAGTAIESATIPGTVTAVGANTFAGCTSLKSITLGKSVAAIESGAFDGCIGLEELHVGSIGQWLSFEFKSCFDSPLYYAGRLFIGKEEAKSIEIPASVTKIGNNAFYHCTSIESVTLHNGIDSIGDYAFAGCTSLSGVTFPESVKTIGTASFSGCSSIKSLTVPSTVSTVGSYAFNLCTSLTTLQFNADVSKIGEAVFRATAITTLTVSDKVSEVDAAAFKDSNKIKQATAPACVFAALDTSRLERATVTSGSTIPPSTFEGCTSLKSAVIGDSVNEIGDKAFKGCTALLSVEFGTSSALTAIGDEAFSSCSRLTSFTLTGGVSEIGNEAFVGCLRLAVVYDLSEALECTLGAFNNGAVALYAYYVHTNASAPSMLIEHADIPEYKFIIYDGGYSLIGYFGDNTVLTLPERVNDASYSIASCAFAVSDIRSLSIPETVYAMDIHALSDTVSIKELAISAALLSFVSPEACGSVETLTVNGSGEITPLSLMHFDSLKTLKLGASVDNVNEMALFSADNLAEITVDPESTSYKSVDGHLYKLTPDGDVLVRACPASSDYFTLPTTVIEIGNYAFAGCSSLTNLYIEEGSVLRRIGDFAFVGCEILYSLELPASIAEIGYNAFASCPYLSEIEFNGTCQKYATVGGCLIDKTAKTVILGFGEGGVVTIPSDGSVTKVATGAIVMSKTITKIVLANGVEYESFSIGALPALETIAVASKDSIYKVVDGCLIKTATKELILATSLAKIPTDGSVTAITATAFAGNTSLLSIVIPDTVTSVDENAFIGCESLVKVTTPVAFVSLFDGSTVTSLTVTGKGPLTSEMLESYTALEELNVGKDVTVAEGALKNCSAIKKITVDEKNTKLKVKDGVLIDISSKTVIAGLSGAKVPADGSVTKIGAYAFAGRTELGNVTIPAKVTSVADTAFEGADGLIECTVSIDFLHLIPRERVTTLILVGGTDLGADDLDGFIALESLTLPRTLDTLLPGLLSAHPTLTTLATDEKHPTLTVIDGCLINKDTKTLIAGVGSCSIPLDGSVTEIARYAFACNEALTSVIIPESVTAFGEGAFEGCTSLDRVYYAGSDYASFAAYTGIPDGADVYLYSAAKPTEDGNFFYLEDGKIKIWW